MKKDEDIFDIALTVYTHKSLAKYPDLADLKAPLTLHTGDLLELAGAEANARAEAIKRYHVKHEPFELFNATAYFIQNALIPAEDKYRILGLRRGATVEEIDRNYQLISSTFFKTEFDLTATWKPDQLRRFNDSYHALLVEVRKDLEKRKLVLGDDKKPPMGKRVPPKEKKLPPGVRKTEDETVILKSPGADLKPQKILSTATEVDHDLAMPEKASAKRQIATPAPAQADPLVAGLETIILDSGTGVPSSATPASDSVFVRQLVEHIGVSTGPVSVISQESPVLNAVGSPDKHAANALEQQLPSAPPAPDATHISEEFAVVTPDTDNGFQNSGLAEVLDAAPVPPVAGILGAKSAHTPETDAVLDSGATMVRSFKPMWFLYTDHKGMPQNEYHLKETTIIGRNRQCDIVIPSPEVSRRHVQLDVINGRLHLTDLGSTNGTYINGERVDKGPIQQGDVMRIDIIEFRVGILGLNAGKTQIRDVAQTRLYAAPATPPAPRMETQLQGLSDPVSGITFSLSKDRMTIGRSLKNDIVIKDSTVSSLHAEIVKERDGWYIRDNDSLNGVYINGKKQQACHIKANDNLRFGRVILELVP